MPVKIGINGFGRIGKLVFQLAAADPQLEIVQINEKRMSLELIAHLLKYDSLHGRSSFTIALKKNELLIDGKKVIVTHHPQPAAINWQKSAAEIVVEASGQFKTRQQLAAHLQSGAEKVILSCPSEDATLDRTVVMGVNEQDLKPADRIISNSSCTTNCVAVVLKVLLTEFGVRRAFMNTVHPFTNNQNLQDGYHADFRRARSALNNIIPTTSSAIESLPLVLPQMQGRFDGFAARVPVADCSFAELTAQLNTSVSRETVNETFRIYAAERIPKFLEYSSDPLVSSDINNNYHSAIIDALSTRVLGGDLIQILAWYDNESGYSARMIDLIKYLAEL